jgi:hypothetical protein
MTISRSAGTGAALAVPFAFVMAHLLLRIEPPLGAVVRAAEETAPFIGTTIVVITLLLALTGLAMTATPLLGNARRGVLASRDNLVVAVVIASLVAVFAGGIVVDQLPCWRGVPNCD